MTSPIYEFDITLDQGGMDTLETTTELMQRGDPSLTIDDCTNAIFMIGLVQVHSTLSMAYLRNHMAQPAESISA